MSVPTDHPASLMKTTGWFASANVLRNLGLLAVLFALTRFSTEEAVGRYAIALAVTTPTFAFAQMGLRGVYLTHRRPLSLVSYIRVQSTAVAAACLVSVAVGAALDTRFGATIALVSAFKAADAFAEFFSGPLQHLNRAHLVFWGFACSAVTGATVVFGSLIMWASLELALVGLVLTTTIVMVVFFIVPVVRLVEPNAGLGGRLGFTTVLQAGLPIGLALSIFALVLTLPQYFLAIYHGEVAVGAFAVFFYIYAAADLLTGTLSMAWIPLARRELESDKGRSFGRFLRRTILQWTTAYVPLGAVGFALAYIIYPAIFPNYPLSGFVIAALACSVLLLPALHFLSAAISVTNLYAHNLTLGAVAAAASLAACIVMIPQGGIVGAFWAVTVGIAARNVIGAIVLARKGSRRRNIAEAELRP